MQNMQKIENHPLKRASHGKLGTFQKSKDAVKNPQHLEAREPRKKHTKTNRSKNYSERVTFVAMGPLGPVTVSTTTRWPAVRRPPAVSITGRGM